MKVIGFAFRTVILAWAAIALLLVHAVAAEEPPALADKVKSGDLPPLIQRLPDDPFVVDYDVEGKKVGRYGGEINLLMAKAKDIQQITVYSYARLIGYGPELVLMPDILGGYEVNEGREFIFRLRPGHKWSDGHPFTSEDFRYFWEDMANHEVLGRKGIPDAMLVDGEPPVFEIVDAQTVRFAWSKPNPAFLPAIAGPSPLYLYRPAHYLKQFHEKYADPAKLEAMVTEANLKDWAALHTGKQRQRRPTNPELPTLQAWKNTTAPPSTRFVFERNPYYHRVDPEGNQLPYVDRLIVNVVSKDVIPAKSGSGETDLQARYLSLSDFPFLKEGEERGGFKALLWSQGKGSQIAIFPNLNTNDPVWRGLLRDVRFRRALSLGIDRDEINEVIYFGQASASANTVLPQSPLFKESYKDAWSQFDPDQANRLLDEAGLSARDSDGIRLLPDGSRAEITIESAGESNEESDVLELITDHWANIGIKIFINSSQRDVFRRRAYTGDSIMSVFLGMNNALASSEMSPEELAPTNQAQLQWPKWGQYEMTQAKAGEPADMEVAAQQLERYKRWLTADDDSQREAIWHEMLQTYTDQVFSIGTVNNSKQPVIVSGKLRNVPEEGVYSWEPTAFFGIYRPDTFWWEN